MGEIFVYSLIKENLYAAILSVSVGQNCVLLVFKYIDNLASETPSTIVGELHVYNQIKK